MATEEYKAQIRKFREENKIYVIACRDIVRVRSRQILRKCHAKLPGYQIHHCFTYIDPNKFIYIPKSLHLKIHQLLKEKNILEYTDHWMAIRDLVNSSEEYVYIRC